MKNIVILLCSKVWDCIAVKSVLSIFNNNEHKSLTDVF